MSVKYKQVNRKKKMNYSVLIFLGFLTLGIIIACFALQDQIDAKVNALQARSSTRYNNKSIYSCNNPSGNARNEEEWCLVLVNKWNPISGNDANEMTKLTNGERIDSRVYPHLQEMFDAARNSGIYPVVASGYRTEEEQQRIYDDKINEYKDEGLSDEQAKKEAEYWVAVPGTSEHQLGLAADINADGIHSNGDEVYEWLADNAYLYGFINRYPADKVDITGVANEPWHYRYVGVDAATEIHDRGICLEEYLDKVNK